MLRIMSISSSSTLGGRRKDGMFERMRPPATLELLEDRDLVAEGREVVRDGERRGARADARDALAVLLGGAFGRRSVTSSL
jgi:hypothetical protein